MVAHVQCSSLDRGAFGTLFSTWRQYVSCLHPSFTQTTCICYGLLFLLSYKQTQARHVGARARKWQSDLHTLLPCIVCQEECCTSHCTLVPCTIRGASSRETSQAVITMECLLRDRHDNLKCVWVSYSTLFTFVTEKVTWKGISRLWTTQQQWQIVYNSAKSKVRASFTKYRMRKMANFEEGP